jgi:hypothetical protein
MDAAETFDGSDGETVFGGLAAVSGYLGAGAFSGTTTGRADDATNYSDDNDRGIVVSPNVIFSGLDLTASQYTSGVTAVEVERLSDNTVLDRQTGLSLSNGDTHTVPTSVTFVPGEAYAVYATNSGATYGYQDYSSGINETGNDLDISNGWVNGQTGSTTSDAATFTDATAASASASSSAIVSWPMPDDLAGWDIVPWIATEDGGTVEVYAVDPDTGDKLLSEPLRDPGDISAIDRSKNVALRVDVSRPDANSNPRLEAVYRRYKV